MGRVRMVRDASKRLKKYEDKVDADVQAKQTRALKPGMVRAQGRYFPQMVTVEQRIKILVEAQGVSTLQVRDYLNYGRELYELTSKFSSQTLNSEAQNRLDKWTARGLDGTTLYNIAKLFGLSPSYTPTPSIVQYLDDLLDVTIGSPLVNAEVLTYETATSKWKNKPLPFIPLNKLAGILGVASVFDTNPTLLERCTDADYTLWTGEGIKSLAGVNGEVGRIVFDMGANYPVCVLVWLNPHRASGDGTITLSLESSSDGITYAGGVSAGISGIAGDLLRDSYPGFCYGRYIRLRFTTASVTVNPSVFHVKLAEVQAIQLP